VPPDAPRYDLSAAWAPGRTRPRRLLRRPGPPRPFIAGQAWHTRPARGVCPPLGLRAAPVPGSAGRRASRPLPALQL